MDVIKANTSDFQQQQEEIEKMERKALEPREISKITVKGKDRERKIEEIKKMSILELRKKYRDFMLPPIEVTISSDGSQHPDYHCPYCNVVLKDDRDLLSCNYCNKKWQKK
jgi:hypothetical protein